MPNVLTIEYTDDVLFSLGLSNAEFSNEIAGMERVEFLFSLSRLKIPMSNLRPEDIDDELKFSRDEWNDHHKYESSSQFVENAGVWNHRETAV